MDKKLIEDAYRKLKGSVYLDKTLPFLKFPLKFPGTLRNQSIKWIVILNKKYEKIWKIGSLLIKMDFYIIKGYTYKFKIKKVRKAILTYGIVGLYKRYKRCAKIEVLKKN